LLRKMVALNEEAPIITEAGLIPTGPVEPLDILESPEFEDALGQPVAGSPISDIINSTPDIGGGGTTAELPVPNILNMTRQEAEDAIKLAGFTVGNVTTVPADGQNFGSFRLIRSAFAAPQPPASASPCLIEAVCVQDPGPGCCLGATLPVNFATGIMQSEVPEPSSLALFITGLLLLVGLVWWRLRRDKRRHA